MEQRQRAKRADLLSPTASGTETGRAIVIEPWLKREVRGEAGRAPAETRTPEARLEEAAGLARAIDLNVVEQGLVTLNNVRPATYVGTGKVDEIAGLVKGHSASVVVMDCPISPVQQRNLEKAWGAKVIDRTGLILEIFGRRARTREGALQVEHAHLNYQKSRLVRSWTHLERQRGGYGFLGGPGETQLEADRRVIEDRIKRIEGELDKVKRTRKLHRDSRKRVPYPIVALVGYTNAGKSTLFNRMTAASVLSVDMLFATLDPTMRGLKLASGRAIILSDTVGFIADLPHELVAAFRATLEEVLEADVILHIRDAAHAETEAQKGDVLKVLDELGIEADGERPMLEVLNKIDLLDSEDRAALLARAKRGGPVAVSALTGEGVPVLLSRIEEALGAGETVFRLHLDSSDGAGLAWAYKHGRVVNRRDRADGLSLTVAVDPADVDRFAARYGNRLSLDHALRRAS